MSYDTYLTSSQSTYGNFWRNQCHFSAVNELPTKVLHYTVLIKLACDYSIIPNKTEQVFCYYFF